jgi:hypothetical protein
MVNRERVICLKDWEVRALQATKTCVACKGIGRVDSGTCNCGSGEGCAQHNKTAIAMWGDRCAVCGGTGAVTARATMLVRPISPQPELTKAGFRWKDRIHGTDIYGSPNVYSFISRSPFGIPGDTLLCKEAYAIESSVYALQPLPFDDGRPVKRHHDPDSDRWWQQAHYRATDPVPVLECEHDVCVGDPCTHPLRPAQTMPRWAVRIKREVVSVRAVSLLEITELEAAATGMYRIGSEWVAPGVMMTCVDRTTAIDWPCHYSALGAFKSRWDDDWDKRGLGWWEKPWVWLCEVKV